MKNENSWYMEALEDTLTEQRFEIDELKAAIAYMESSKDVSEAHSKMLAEYKRELAMAEADLESAERYVESQRKYAA